GQLLHFGIEGRPLAVELSGIPAIFLLAGVMFASVLVVGLAFAVAAAGQLSRLVVEALLLAAQSQRFLVQLLFALFPVPGLLERLLARCLQIALRLLGRLQILVELAQLALQAIDHAAV